jgi:hypothetical protein
MSALLFLSLVAVLVASVVGIVALGSTLGYGRDDSPSGSLGFGPGTADERDAFLPHRR